MSYQTVDKLANAARCPPRLFPQGTSAQVCNELTMLRGPEGERAVSNALGAVRFELNQRNTTNGGACQREQTVGIRTGEQNSEKLQVLRSVDGGTMRREGVARGNRVADRSDRT